MKNVFSRHYSLVSFFALCCAIIGLSACQKEPIIGCEHPISKDSLCSGKEGKTIAVRVGSAVCGYGVWGGLWLQPINAPFIATQWLQPYSLEKGLSFQPKVGDNLQITYTNAQLDDRYKNLTICMAYPGSSQPIHILCIKPAKDSTQTSIITKQVVLQATGCGTGFYGDRWFYDEQTQEYLQPCQFGKPTLSYQSLVVGRKYEISYNVSTSKECQNNYPTNSVCVWLPKATSIDLLSIKANN